MEKNILAILNIEKMKNGTPIKIRTLDEYNFFKNIMDLFNDKYIMAQSSLKSLDKEIIEQISHNGFVYLRFNLINFIRIVKEKNIDNFYSIKDIIHTDKRDALVNILKEHIKVSKKIIDSIKKSGPSIDEFAISIGQSVKDRQKNSISIMHMAIDEIIFKKRKSHQSVFYKDISNVYRYINGVNLKLTF